MKVSGLATQAGCNQYPIRLLRPGLQGCIRPFCTSCVLDLPHGLCLRLWWKPLLHKHTRTGCHVTPYFRQDSRWRMVHMHKHKHTRTHTHTHKHTHTQTHTHTHTHAHASLAAWHVVTEHHGTHRDSDPHVYAVNSLRESGRKELANQVDLHSPEMQTSVAG